MPRPCLRRRRPMFAHVFLFAATPVGALVDKIHRQRHAPCSSEPKTSVSRSFFGVLSRNGEIVLSLPAVSQSIPFRFSLLQRLPTQQDQLLRKRGEILTTHL